MKYMKQMAIILAMSALGELCYFFLPFPIPASIYGLCFLLISFETGLVSLNQVEDVGDFLIEIMPFMFIPAAVGLMSVWADLQAVLLPFFVIILLSTILVFVVSGKVTDFMMKRGKKGD